MGFFLLLFLGVVGWGEGVLGVLLCVVMVYEVLFLVGFGVGVCSNFGMDYEYCFYVGVLSELFSLVLCGVL